MKSMNLKHFVIGLLSALGLSALASVPRQSQDSVAIQDEVSEIRVKRHAELSADADLKRLSALQGRYRENMPLRKRQAAHPRRDQIRTSHAGSVRKPAPRTVKRAVRTRSAR